MRNSFAVAAAVATLLGTASFAALAQGGVQQQDRQRLHQPAAAPQPGRQVYGRQLMTQQEIRDYRARMRAAKTVQERERIRAEHHKQMQERARQRGVTLPDLPPPRGMGGGMGPGMGGGMGGQGTGRGMGGGQPPGAGN